MFLPISSSVTRNYAVNVIVFSVKMKMMIQKSHCIFCKSTWFFDNIVQPFVWPKLGPKVTIQACLKFLTLQMLLYSFQNFDTEEPRLSPIVSVNCNSEQFCGDHYLTHTKSNQACQIEAAGFPASLVSQCVSASPPSLSTAQPASQLPRALSLQHSQYAEKPALSHVAQPRAYWSVTVVRHTALN